MTDAAISLTGKYLIVFPNEKPPKAISEHWSRINTAPTPERCATSAQDDMRTIANFSLECPICYYTTSDLNEEKPIDMRITACGHIACLDCINHSTNPYLQKCPKCRSIRDAYLPLTSLSDHMYLSNTVPNTAEAVLHSRFFLIKGDEYFRRINYILDPDTGFIGKPVVKLSREEAQQLIDAAVLAGERPDLSYRDLSNINLSYVNFNCAKLHNANMTGALLDHADLRGVDFSGSDFTEIYGLATAYTDTKTKFTNVKGLGLFNRMITWLPSSSEG